MAEGKASRFDYVQYDDDSENAQRALKESCVSLESRISALPDGRAKSLALTALEECYMWCGKAVRDDQIKRNGSAPLQEARTNS